MKVYSLHYRIVNFRLHHLIQNLNPICCWCVFIRCMCISFSITNFATNLQLPFLVTLMKIIYDRFYIPLCILHTGWCGLAHPTTLSSLRAFIGKKIEKRLLILDVQKKSHVHAKKKSSVFRIQKKITNSKQWNSE